MLTISSVNNTIIVLPCMYNRTYKFTESINKTTVKINVNKPAKPTCDFSTGNIRSTPNVSFPVSLRSKVKVAADSKTISRRFWFILIKSSQNHEYFGARDRF